MATAAQMAAAGVARSTISRWARKGLLHREYRGVYRVGHRAPSVEARYLAAVLACGAGAGLSGHAAAYHLQLVTGRRPPPEVTAPVKRIVRGVITHRGAPATKTHRGIPTTTVAQTLEDLAPRLALKDLARACHHADILHRVTGEHVRTHNVPGAAKLRAILHGDHPTTLSELEDGFLDALREADLPIPTTNRPEGAHYIDCRWSQHRLTVELDSYRFHRSRHAWEQDRERERAARARGDDHRRYTWADVHEHREAMLADLRALLSRRYPSTATAR